MYKLDPEYYLKCRSDTEKSRSSVNWEEEDVKMECAGIFLDEDVVSGVTPVEESTVMYCARQI